MKKLFFLFLIFGATYGHAQDTTRRNRIELFYGLNKVDLTYSSNFVGAGTLTTTAADAFGLSYVHAFNKYLAIESGLSLLFVDYLKTGAPGVNFTELHQVAVLTVPLKLRLNFARYFFVNGGLIVDLEMMNTDTGSQNGAGVSAGFGAKYDFKSGFGVYLNPMYNGHNMFRKATASAPNMQESSINFGLSLSF